MQSNDKEKFSKMLRTTMSVCGGSSPEPEILKVWWAVLAGYDYELVASAFGKYIATAKFPPKPADIREIIESKSDNKRIGADEAWATAILAQDESETVVWTQEAAEAFGIVKPLLDMGDEIGARVGFRDAYNRLCSKSISDNVAPCWLISSGWDSEKRRNVIEKAVTLGRISNEYAVTLLPAPIVKNEEVEKLLALVCRDVNKADDEHATEVEKVKDHLNKLKSMINGSKK